MRTRTFFWASPSTMTQDAPVERRQRWVHQRFAQDDFRIHSRVTLNLGLRYDVQFPFTDPTTASSPFVPGRQSTSLRRLPWDSWFR